MGVLEFFGTIVKSGITASSVKTNVKEKLPINHLFLDFNSIVHVASQKITLDINVFMRLVLKGIYQKSNFKNMVFNELFKKYKMEEVQQILTSETEPEEVIRLFHEHFDEKMLDKAVISLVINTVLQIIRTYTENTHIKTLLLAIDGVPSKGKMVEQRQRRYMGAIMADYSKKLFTKYTPYLEGMDNYLYLAEKNAVKWSRNKITPGTAFMHKMSRYLNSDPIQLKLKANRPELNVIVSDMYEVGEGEKKIVNYIVKNLYNTKDTVMVYSPDADVILLCMLLPVKKVHMLRYNQQLYNYDLIDVQSLKANIAYYINNNPSLKTKSKTQFDTDRITYDMVCLSTLFGNDFVPKMESLNVKKGFQNIMDAYLLTLLKFEAKQLYLIKVNEDDHRDFSLSFSFLKEILKELQPEEDDFIKNNHLYNQYINFGQLRNIFDYEQLSSENILSVISDFRQEYENLKNLIRNNGDYTYFKNNDQFMESLKKSVTICMDNLAVNTTYLTNVEMINLLTTFYRKQRDFPKVNVNLKLFSRKSSDFMHKNKMKEMNDYEKEVYRFTNMLDEYYTKCNAQPLDLSKGKIDQYYTTYFGINLYNKGTQVLTPEATEIMHDYLEGLLWVFNYYFNDTTYVNRWSYQHERAPLMRHFIMFLDKINNDYFKDVYNGLQKYQVTDLKTFFNPIEQLIYVSPMTREMTLLLPSNYRNFINSDDLDPFLKNYFIDIKDIVNRFWKERVSDEMDCRGIPYFNKCIIKSIHKPDIAEDKQFLKAIRKVVPNKFSIRRSKSEEPDY